MSREVQSVFPDVDLTNMLVVPTCQQADYDLVRTGEKIDCEKDRLLERVSGLSISWANTGPDKVSLGCAGWVVPSRLEAALLGQMPVL